MAKTLNNWLEEFVKNGADPKNVTDWPETAGGSGAIIVDALPADGKEGQTYLLRKAEENSIFKVHCYNVIYCQGEAEYWGYVLVGDGDIEARFLEAFEKKLDPTLGEDVVKFDEGGLITSVIQASSSEWEAFINGVSSKAIVETEQDVLDINEQVYYIIQDLGEIGIEDFDIAEGKIVSETYSAEIYCDSPNSLTKQSLFIDTKVIFRTRKIQFNGLEADILYTFTEWNENTPATIVGTLTDTYEYNREVLQTLTKGDFYHIILTPEEPTYSYTQYVFDKGIYTEVGGKTDEPHLYQYFVAVNFTSEGKVYDARFVVDSSIDIGLNSIEDLELIMGLYHEYPATGTSQAPSDRQSLQYQIKTFMSSGNGDFLFATAVGGGGFVYNMTISQGSTTKKQIF